VKDAGFELEAEVPLMDDQYFLRFKKRAKTASDEMADK